MKLVSIVSPCYNEEENVDILIERVRTLFAGMPQYRYEHILIDNNSSDRTVDILRGIALDDPHVKVIVNARNFGHIRSPQHAILEAQGDAVVVLLSDLQDPPELIGEFLREWEAGYPIVVATKSTSDESGLMYGIRSVYYRTIARLTDVKVVEHFTGFGLYDRQVIEILKRDFPDPHPYFRGQIAEIGLPTKVLHYNQKRRMRGITKNNFYTLYDMAMLGITNLSKVPLRLVIFTGFVFAFLSLIAGLVYLVYKLVYWNRFELGLAPLMIGLFFLGSIQLVALGIIGEYIGSVHTIVQGRPLVTEKERINF
ncbi:glycosyltransferase family 2 protein [Granulicella tundricola]|uniref:Glycosyl transferase family 2 n=1 Tax=Granulicella tundricola (strain ATCC BAA-1859 / DSM 23138 / MP5ACTX9) TaxID=1198114 RepID=E8WV88_GRATM|nr:glycosyltransferase family 2 protein [Granulicella tundricola]ADW67263.1 glycosyl transferase family 2 [Granulicella tundricola MP5ACTX9]